MQVFSRLVLYVAVFSAASEMSTTQLTRELGLWLVPHAASVASAIPDQTSRQTIALNAVFFLWIWEIA